MKSIKRKLQDSRRQAHQAFADWLRPKMAAIGIRWRLTARIRLANA